MLDSRCTWRPHTLNGGSCGKVESPWNGVSNALKRKPHRRCEAVAEGKEGHNEGVSILIDDNNSRCVWKQLAKLHWCSQPFCVGHCGILSADMNNQSIKIKSTGIESKERCVIERRKQWKSNGTQ